MGVIVVIRTSDDGCAFSSGGFRNMADEHAPLEWNLIRHYQRRISNQLRECAMERSCTIFLLAQNWKRRVSWARWTKQGSIVVRSLDNDE